MKYRLLNIVIFLIVIFLSSTCRCIFQLQHIYTHTQTHKHRVPTELTKTRIRVVEVYS